jgi:hypothetical protein
MKLGDLVQAGAVLWPPRVWAGSYGPGDRFPRPDQGVLTAVRFNEREGVLFVEREFEKRRQSAALVWDGPKNAPTPER